MTRGPGRTAALCVAAALTGAAAAQTEFRLDESGRWVEVSRPESAPDEAIIATARRDLAEGRFSAARDALDAWIRTNERGNNPLLPQAYLLRGDALTALGDEYTALYDYETVCKQFAASEEFVKAVERELDIAVRYVNGYKRRLFFARILDASDIGEELLIRVQERLPASRIAERAGIELADYYFRIGDMEMAADAYRLFIDLYPRSAYVATAMQRRIYATISRFKGPRYDNTPLTDASILTRKFASLYPAQAQSAGLDEALLARLDESAAAGMLESARWYLAVNDPVSARYVLRRLINKFPRTAAAGAAFRVLAERGWDDGIAGPVKPEAVPAPVPGAGPAPSSPPAAPRPRGGFVPAKPLRPAETGPGPVDPPTSPPPSNPSP